MAKSPIPPPLRSSALSGVALRNDFQIRTKTSRAIIPANRPCQLAGVPKSNLQKDLPHRALLVDGETGCFSCPSIALSGRRDKFIANRKFQSLLSGLISVSMPTLILCQVAKPERPRA